MLTSLDNAVTGSQRCYAPKTFVCANKLTTLAEGAKNDVLTAHLLLTIPS